MLSAVHHLKAIYIFDRSYIKVSRLGCAPTYFLHNNHLVRQLFRLSIKYYAPTSHPLHTLHEFAQGQQSHEAITNTSPCGGTAVQTWGGVEMKQPCPDPFCLFGVEMG